MSLPPRKRARRGGRAVDCAGLENRKAERPREFESHPLRFPSLPGQWLNCITVSHNKLANFKCCSVLFVEVAFGRCENGAEGETGNAASLRTTGAPKLAAARASPAIRSVGGTASAR
jgi:hypothetical protein